MISLQTPTSQQWLDTVLNQFDAFLLDHAACERKASASALALVAHFRDKDQLVASMIELSLEELRHFQQVYQWIHRRGLRLGPDRRDPYVGRLRQQIRRGREVYLLDQLVINAVVEARGCERFGRMAEGVAAGPLQEFYAELSRAEARHQGLFVKLAREYFSADEVAERLDQLLAIEAEVIEALPLRPVLH